MYTQCAKCETVFRLSAEVLRAAGGQVRCGRCGEVFNALASLAEDASTFPAGESALELEARADEILQSTVPPLSPSAPAGEDSEDLGATDVEFARLQVLDMLDDDDAKDAPEMPEPAPPPRRADSAKAAEAAKAAAALKLAAAARAAAGLKAAASKAPPAGAKSGDAVKPRDLAKPGGGVRSASPAEPGEVAKPADGGRLGGAAKSAGSSGSADARKPAPPPPAAAASPDEQEDGSLEFTLPPGELDRIFVEAPPRPAESAAPAAPGQGTEPIRGEGARGRVAGLDVPEDVRREMLEGMNEELLLPQIQAPAHRPLPFALWLGAALVLALLLGAQMILENRGWLAAHAPLRGALHGLFVALGVASAAPATLSAYQLRQWGVTGDPSASGTLRVRASILNSSPQLQPYPLLRVTLANRFGARIGMRDFEPAEYMGKPIVRMLAPGERADPTLDIVDPGKDAEGFEIDVCLRNIEQKISCAGDAAAQPGAAQPSAAQPKQ